MSNIENVCTELCLIDKACQVQEAELPDGTQMRVSDRGYDARYAQLCRHFTCVVGEKAARSAIRYGVPDEFGHVQYNTSEKPEGRFVNVNTREVFSIRTSDGQRLSTGQKIR